MHHVLVRGTTQSPRGWDRLAAILTAGGHRVTVVDLPTNRPELSAADYAAVASEQVTGAAEDLTIVAHSAAGLLVPALANRLHAQRVVWLAAAIPDFKGGASFAEQINAGAAQIFNDEWLALSLSPEAEMDPVISTYFLFHDCDYETLRWALETTELLNLRSVYAEPPTPLPPGVESVAIVPRHDRTLRPSWMRQAATVQLGVEPVEVDGGHCPYVSHPEAVAAAITA